MSLVPTMCVPPGLCPRRRAYMIHIKAGSRPGRVPRQLTSPDVELFGTTLNKTNPQGTQLSCCRTSFPPPLFYQPYYLLTFVTLTVPAVVSQCILSVGSVTKGRWSPASRQPVVLQNSCYTVAWLQCNGCWHKPCVLT